MKVELVADLDRCEHLKPGRLLLARELMLTHGLIGQEFNTIVRSMRGAVGNRMIHSAS